MICLFNLELKFVFELPNLKFFLSGLPGISSGFSIPSLNLICVLELSTELSSLSVVCHECSLYVGESQITFCTRQNFCLMKNDLTWTPDTKLYHI